ncbi:hypothetical protein SAMN02787142_7734 [Burkholderia sp. WP9]|uniref:hypothetical protein n=1 Tax=Burkholderia sp. WP9 TaxID=1500263 RepID=UPI000898C803|nr:hypothetical protein [Burkholderia sp. WP9]SEF11618.1 hypothetical protein SAMN02787142_7734 [Burkholderia sp. WP9]
MKQLNRRDRDFAAFLLSRSPLDAARAVAPRRRASGPVGAGGETLLHVSLRFVVKVGATDADTPRLTSRIADLSRAVCRSMRTLIERLKAYD